MKPNKEQVSIIKPFKSHWSSLPASWNNINIHPNQKCSIFFLGCFPHPGFQSPLGKRRSSYVWCCPSKVPWCPKKKMKRSTIARLLWIGSLYMLKAFYQSKNHVWYIFLCFFCWSPTTPIHQHWGPQSNLVQRQGNVEVLQQNFTSKDRWWFLFCVFLP